MIYIILTFLISLSLTLISYITQSIYIHDFLSKSVIEIMAIILAVNCASASNIHLKLIDQEQAIGEKCFSKTKREIRHNALFLIIGFLITLILSFLASFFQNEKIIYGFDCAILTIFFLYIYALYELTIKFILNLEPLTTNQH